MNPEQAGQSLAKKTKSFRRDEYLGRVIAGRYRLETQLGEGGMGVVYRARHVLIDRTVAVKLIRPDLRSETHLRAWMLREARAANRVDHAHIVDIHDVGETEEGDLYLVMEYLVGTSLASECGKGPMPISRAVDILEQMCAALARAHDLGVVHRDLKSDNIMLTDRGGRRDFVKILDFGLAGLAREARLAPKGAVFGTPEYMSPEQARGEDANALSDLYSLGILFYEMLTGQLPFRSGDRETLLEMQRSAPSPKPRAIRADIPETAEGIILKLLEKDPRRRFRDGHHLQEELKAFQRQLPSTAAWEGKLSEVPTPPSPPPVRTPDVVIWSKQASHYARMLARSYPNGQAPVNVQQASERLWQLAASASRLEGELSSHARKLDAVERRGRALRAEIGRRVEDLAQEESRALREAATEREREARLRASVEEAEKVYEAAERKATQLDQQGSTDLPTIRVVFEQRGAARANVQALRQVCEDYESRARRRESHARSLRQQIDDLRQQLQRYSEALESDLALGREKIASRVQEALQFESGFAEGAKVLFEHLRERPECRDLLKELTDENNKNKPMSEVAPARAAQ